MSAICDTNAPPGCIGWSVVPYTCYHRHMPSWNVHTAHVQELIAEVGLSSLGVRDENAFLFGNYVPDIFVGYMVENPSGILPYGLTHFADAEHIPVPREQQFWDLFVEPCEQIPPEVPVHPAPLSVEQGVAIMEAGGHFAIPATPTEHATVEKLLHKSSYYPTDVVLGAWAHLLCDNEYNTSVRAWFSEHGIQTGEEARIKKQDDFLQFGRTLPVTLTCHVDETLCTQAAAFPQYAIGASDVEAACEAADAIVEDNQEHQITSTPDYSLFTPEFFDAVYERAHARICERLQDYARRHPQGDALV